MWGSGLGNEKITEEGVMCSNLRKVYFVDVPEMELTQYTISKSEQRLIDMRVLK